MVAPSPSPSPSQSPSRSPAPAAMPTARGHVAALHEALDGLDVDRLEAWGRRLAQVLPGGRRLLAAGNGGSAAEAQHLTAELVGRFRDDRAPMSAVALHADTSSLTAIGNDYGFDDVFARQVRAHGRPGDVLVLLSTSGRSANLLRAAEVAQDAGVTAWALVGSLDCPLATACDEVVAVDRCQTATVQEAHLVAVHVICAACDVAMGVATERDDDAGAAVAGSTDPAADSPETVLPEAVAVRRHPGSASARPLLVVGDALLDRDVVGDVDRLAPDAPVPVLDEVDDQARPGGAGLAALLAARDGFEVVLVTALAADLAGRRLAELLVDAGVEVVDLGLDGTTPQKIRMRVGDRTLLRLDRGHGGRVRDSLTERGRRAVSSARAVLVSDYGRGLARHESVLTALKNRGRRVPLVWDPHTRGGAPLTGAQLATPNLAEARSFTADLTSRADLVAEATDRGRQLVQRWGASSVAVTLGDRGALLVGGCDTPPLVAPAVSVAGADPCGAGDRFAVTATGRLGAGALPSEAVVAATHTAGKFVAAGGVCGGANRGGGGNQADGDAVAVVRRTRARGGVVVATGGCFDLLHAGHVAVLAAARRLGDCLVVCLNSDDSVRRLKGPDRPLVSEADRAAVLRALGCVDAVAVFDEDTPTRLLNELRPDVFAKGGDYAVSDLPEAAVLASWHGEAVVLPYLEGRSTTSMIREAVRRGGS